LRRTLAAFGGVLALLIPATATANSLSEPVTITADAPASVTAGAPFDLTVAVEADPAALGIAAMPLRVRVKLAPECGGSFAGTPGPAAFEATLPNPVPAGPYAQTFTGRVTAPTPGTETVCAFLEDAQERQFATDSVAQTEAVASAAGAGGGGNQGAPRACPAATRKASAAGLDLKRLQKRIQKLRRAEHKAHGKHRRRLAKRLRALRRKERALRKRSRAAAHVVAGSCR
jgi:hypothetical protein